MAMPEQNLVLVAIDGGIARITLNRPDRLNALDHALAMALATTLEGLERDPALRAVTLMGAGRMFMAGGGNTAFKKNRHDAPNVLRGAGYSFHPPHPPPRAACAARAARGCASGGAVGLALACDFVVASDDASFVPAYTKLGTSPDGGTTWSVTRLLGPQRAFAWLMLGEPIDARAAMEIGLIHRVVPKDALTSE